MLSWLKMINLFHIIIVAPLLWAVGTNRIPQQYMYLFVWLAVLVVIFHLYRFLTSSTESMIPVAAYTGDYPNCKSTINQEGHHILINDLYGYNNQELVINPGEMVTWINIGEIQHTVTSDTNLFNSGYLRPFQSFTVKFTNPGIYPYGCITHSGGERGVIIVE